MIDVQLAGLGKKTIHTLGIGVFDGLHLGHQAIAEQCDALLTFDPHPDRVLRKNQDVKSLTTPRELRQLFDHVIVLHFNKQVAQLSAIEFLDQVIFDQIKPKAICVGYDFAFGAKKQGNVETLIHWAKPHGLDVVIVHAFKQQKKIIKSSDIRLYLEEGEFEQAIQTLGHPYLVIGEVVKGEGRGSRIGFPTANLNVPKQKLIPSPGVYGGSATLSGTDHPAIIYIGRKPTFGQHDLGIEVHIPGFSGSLYGKQLKVTLTHKIRGEKTFKHTDALTLQIREDLKKLVPSH